MAECHSSERISFLLRGLLLRRLLLLGRGLFGCRCLLGRCLFGRGWLLDGRGLNLVSVVGVGLLLLEELGEDLVVLGFLLLGLLVPVELDSLEHLLPPDALLGDQSLDLGRLVERLVTLLDLSAHDILSNVVLLPEGEDLPYGRGAFGAKSPGLVSVGDALDLLITFLDDSQGDNCQVRSADAAPD